MTTAAPSTPSPSASVPDVRVADSPLAAIAFVRVGTQNGPKRAAVEAALAAYAPDVRVEGAAVESGVAEQPVGHAEIVRGARNRARAAFALGGCDLAVGIEDGLVELALEPGHTVVNVGCAAVFDGTRESLGFSSGFAYPPDAVAPAIGEREPIGDVFDALWRREKDGASVAGEDASGRASALSVGNVGKLTLGVLPRAEYARHAVLCALVRFLHPDLYPHPDPNPDAAIEGRESS